MSKRTKNSSSNESGLDSIGPNSDTESVVLGKDNQSVASSACTPKPKRRRARPELDKIEGQEKKSQGGLATLFLLTFRPTRNPDLSRDSIVNLLLPMAKQLIVSKCDSLMNDCDKCPTEWVIFIRLKDDTEEMARYNARCRQRDTKLTNKKRPEDWPPIFAKLNQWPVDVLHDKVSFECSFCTLRL